MGPYQPGRDSKDFLEKPLAIRMEHADNAQHAGGTPPPPVLGHISMLQYCKTFVTLPTPLALVALSFALLAGDTAQAGIVLPQEVGFDAADLDQSFSATQSGGASSSSSSQRPIGEDTPSPPGHEDLHTALPASPSSSSSSTSTSGAGSSPTLVVFTLSRTVLVPDDACLGRLAEECGLSLPMPPGTDLLRPPRSV